MFSNRVHRFFYLLGIVVLLVGLPFSPFLISVGQFILAGNWLFELDFKRKFSVLAERHSILLIASIFIIHVLWLINTSNFNYAVHDLKIKVPLLALPIIFGTTNPLTRQEFKYILHFFIAAVFVATWVSAFIYFGIGTTEVIDSRYSSIFISHIRFALMIVLSNYLVIGMLCCNKKLGIVHPLIYIGVIIWFILYLFFIGAFSGVVITLIVFPIMLLYWLKSMPTKNPLKIAWVVLSIFFIAIVSYSSYCFIKYTQKKHVDLDSLATYTENGNRYKHFPNEKNYENGNLIWINICDIELKEQWNLRSELNFKGKDIKGQTLRSTLIRYLTSLGYSKDSIGVSRLTASDIAMIEKGVTNYLMQKKWTLYPRIYELLWEIEHYVKTGNPNGHSLSMRIELTKNGFRTAKRFFLFGTGTGDVNDEIMRQYDLDKSVLKANWRFRPHNQYLTLIVAFGFLGFIILVFLFGRGMYLEKNNIDFFSLVFVLIVLLSMISEDTLETQAGATFFACFYSLFLLGRNVKNSSSS